MNIERRYWIWNPELNNTAFKLGANATSLIEKGILINIGDAEYTTKGESPWSVMVHDEKISSLFFRGEIDLLKDKAIWDFELSKFCEKMDTILEPANEDSTGMILKVVFRVFFVAIAGISIK